MANVLVVAEQRDGAVKRVSMEAIAAARSVADVSGGAVHVLVVGPPATATDDLTGSGADTVFRALGDEAALYQADLYAATAAARAEASDAALVLVAATALGKDLAPRIAARLGCGLVADVSTLERSDDGLVATRAVYSAKAMMTVRLTGRRSVVSVRPNAFTPLERGDAPSVEDMALASVSARARTVRVEQPEQAALDVAEASVVVSGGRGLKEPAHFALVEELAAALGGAVGASRAVVDAGWRPHAEQVGQTGKTVSPSLYVAVGISGAVQHLAGMRTSQVIVAINKDKDAPIFKVADYGIVGDLFEIVPRLTEEIRTIKEQ
jgi:electron transfer flavoprotein alpha subunit